MKDYWASDLMSVPFHIQILRDGRQTGGGPYTIERLIEINKDQDIFYILQHTDPKVIMRARRKK